MRTILLTALLLLGTGNLAMAEGEPVRNEPLALASLIDASGAEKQSAQSKRPGEVETAQSCSGTNHLCYWGNYYWCCPQFYSCGQKGMCVDMN